MAIFVVSGLGRCGSSLVMQMLEAGGVPVTGEWPSFESALGLEDLDNEQMKSLDGKAIKKLVPYQLPMPAGWNYVVMWIDRDPVQQAISSIKFLRTMFSSVPCEVLKIKKSDVLRYARNYNHDREKSLRALNRVAAKIIYLRFEELLSSPRYVANVLDYNMGGGLDVEAMTRAVLPRGPECQPSLDIEFRLLRSREVESADR